MADPFPLSGGIDPASFPFLLANLHQQGATGSLIVDGPSSQKALYFRGGRILFGSSNDPHDQLGAILIESGRLSDDQLESASGKVGPGNPLAKVLADSGLVSQRDLAEAARAKVERILSDLFAMPSGSFEFEDDVLPKGAIDLKLATPRLFVAALRRVDEHAFVQRHLGGLDVVPRLTAAAGEGLGEIAAELGALPELLDGRRSLREAARQAQLDPFEAAKLACALLFLGLLEKPREPTPTFEAIESEADEFDLASSTRITFDFAPSDTPAPGAAPAPAGGPDESGETPFFLSNESDVSVPLTAAPHQLDPATFATPQEPEPEPDPEPELEPTLRLAAPEPSAPAPRPPAPDVEAPPPPVTPPKAVPPAVARSGASGLPLVPPPPRVPPPARPPAARQEAAEPTLQPKPSPRPSKEDLEALDTLLNARSLESPLVGSTGPEQPAAAPTRRMPAWEPSFGRGTPGRGRPSAPRARATRNRSRTGWVVLGLLGVVLLGGGAWYWFGRTPVAAPPGVGVVKPLPLPAATTSPSPPPSPLAVGTAPPLMSPPPPSDDDDTPSAPPVRPTPAVATAAPRPGPTAPPRATPPAASHPSSTEAARAALGRGDLSAAGQGFVGTLRAAPRTTFSVQLLLACSPDTVTKAVANAGAPELFIVPIRYKGRDCYRVCWGLYDGRARAEGALRSLPQYFRARDVHPKVVSAAELLP